MSFTSPTFWLSGPSTSVPLNFEASHWSGFCAAMNCTSLAFMSTFGVSTFGVSWVAAGGDAGLDGAGACASAVPSANALTAEINASLLSIAGLHGELFQEASCLHRPPPAAVSTRDRQPCSV